VRGLARPVEPSFLPFKADQDFPLPPFPGALNPHWGEVHGYPVLDARAQEGVDVRVRRSAHAAVLVDGEDTLCAPGGAAEGLLHGVTQDAVAEWTVEPPEALGRGGVHGQDEPEVDGVPEPARILPEGLPDGLLVTPQGPVTVADSGQLAPAPVGQSLLAVGDVAHLSADATGVPVVARLDEEQSGPVLVRCVPGAREGSLRIRKGLLPLVGAHDANLGHELLFFADLHGPVPGRPVGEIALRFERRWTEKLGRRRTLSIAPSSSSTRPAGTPFRCWIVWIPAARHSRIASDRVVPPRLA
jgi:hypothetical protein